MDIKTLLWYGVLGSLTGAYFVALAGARAAHHHEVAHHSRRMIIACTIVLIWLVAYVTKQVVFGRERFGGSDQDYWRWYAPVFAAHMALALATIGLGAYNLYTGLRRLRYGSVGAMAAGITRHRQLGKLMIWTFSGTMVTAYVVYLLLFIWFSSGRP